MLSTVFYLLAHLSAIVLNMISLLVIVAVAITWFDVNPYNRYARWIRRMTEPMFGVFRPWLGFIGGFDLSPMLVMLILAFMQKALPTYLMALSFRYAVP